MPPRLTARDQSITAWVARWHPVTGYQVARAFAIHHVIAYRRLATLRKLGYLHSQRPVQELPGIYSVTHHGFGLIGMRARGMRTNPFNLWGELATVDQVVEDQLAGATVLSVSELHPNPASISDAHRRGLRRADLARGVHARRTRRRHLHSDRPRRLADAQIPRDAWANGRLRGFPSTRGCASSPTNRSGPRSSLRNTRRSRSSPSIRTSSAARTRSSPPLKGR